MYANFICCIFLIDEETRFLSETSHLFPHSVSVKYDMLNLDKSTAKCKLTRSNTPDPRLSRGHYCNGHRCFRHIPALHSISYQRHILRDRSKGHPKTQSIYRRGSYCQWDSNEIYYLGEYCIWLHNKHSLYRG
jgi:hypothetical protein